MWVWASVGGLVLFVALVAGLDLLHKPEPLLPGNRRCHWCRYQGHPVQVLFHEIEEHRA